MLTQNSYDCKSMFYFLAMTAEIPFISPIRLQKYKLNLAMTAKTFQFFSYDCKSIVSRKIILYLWKKIVVYPYMYLDTKYFCSRTCEKIRAFAVVTVLAMTAKAGSFWAYFSAMTAKTSNYLPIISPMTAEVYRYKYIQRLYTGGYYVNWSDD